MLKSNLRHASKYFHRFVYRQNVGNNWKSNLLRGLTSDVEICGGGNFISK